LKEVHKIKDLEQIRLLTDPLKLKLIQAFAEKPRTTKQVAEALGESVTKLYRHVDALFDAGLLEIVEEKQKRGTIERTFSTVAQRFEADHSLFADGNNGEGVSAAREVLRGVEDEIIDVLASAEKGEEQEAVLMRLRGKASPQRIAELQKSLTEWIESTQSEFENDDENGQEIGAFIAFYPVHNKKNQGE
jgi:DNA-binding transcriptional ArsR family regulator